MQTCIRQGAARTYPRLAHLAACSLAVLMQSWACAQQPQSLKPGKPVEITLDHTRLARLRVSARQTHLMRVFVTAIDGAMAPKVVAKSGKRRIDAELFRFQNHSVLEWPCTQDSDVVVTVRGKSAQQRYGIKLATLPIPLVRLPYRDSEVAFDLAIAPTAWRRVPLEAKVEYQFQRATASRSPGSVAVSVIGANGRVRHSTKKKATRWQAKAKENAYLRLRRPVDATGVMTAQLRTASERMSRMRPLFAREQFAEELPPVPKWPQEVPLDVTQGSAARADIAFGEDSVGRTFLLEVVGLSLKDPTMSVRSTDGKLLGWDDDSGDGANARLRLKVTSDPHATVLVRPFGAGNGGTAKLRYWPEK